MQTEWILFCGNNRGQVVAAAIQVRVLLRAKCESGATGAPWALTGLDAALSWIDLPGRTSIAGWYDSVGHANELVLSTLAEDRSAYKSILASSQGPPVPNGDPWLSVIRRSFRPYACVWNCRQDSRSVYFEQLYWASFRFPLRGRVQGPENSIGQTQVLLQKKPSPLLNLS